MATNPVDRPPEEVIRIPAVDQDRPQAREQEWQPIHCSIRGVVSVFIIVSRLRYLVAGFNKLEELVPLRVLAS